jgi:hypothetical protein
MRIANSITLALALVVVVGCASRQPAVVELPRPNSGPFTDAQAEARKSEIYCLAQSGMKTEWKNPYMGFSVHITREDTVVVYSGLLSDRGTVSIPQLQVVLTNYHRMQYGNPLGVLITSERDPRSSATLPRVIELLFKPSVQIFYVRRA